MASLSNIFPVLVTYMISQPKVEDYAREKGIALYWPGGRPRSLRHRSASLFEQKESRTGQTVVLAWAITKACRFWRKREKGGNGGAV